MFYNLKWIGTLLCAGGIFFTSINVFPLNIVLGGIGSALWVFVAFRTKDGPLFTIEFYATIVYVVGFISWWVSPVASVKQVCEPNRSSTAPQSSLGDWDNETSGTILINKPY